MQLGHCPCSCPTTQRPLQLCLPMLWVYLRKTPRQGSRGHYSVGVSLSTQNCLLQVWMKTDRPRAGSGTSEFFPVWVWSQGLAQNVLIPQWPTSHSWSLLEVILPRAIPKHLSMEKPRATTLHHPDSALIGIWEQLLSPPDIVYIYQFNYQPHSPAPQSENSSVLFTIPSA